MPGFLVSPVNGAVGVTNIPSGNISSTNIQDAINELDTEKADFAYVDNAESDANLYTDNAVSGLVDAAPETLNTLNELSAALGDDSNFATTVTNSLASKAPLESPDFSTSLDVNNSSVVNTGAKNIIGFPDRKFLKYSWRYGFNYPDSPPILQFYRNYGHPGGGGFVRSYLISTASRTYGGHSGSLIFISIEGIYNQNGFYISASRIAGNANSAVYVTQNSGQQLKFEVWADSSGDDTFEYNVFEMTMGGHGFVDDDNDGLWSIIGYSQRGGGTKIL